MEKTMEHEMETVVILGVILRLYWAYLETSEPAFAGRFLAAWMLSPSWRLLAVSPKHLQHIILYWGLHRG